MIVSIVVLTIVVFVLVDGVLRLMTFRRSQSKVEKEQQLGPEIGLQPLPSGLFVDPGHTWVEIQRSGMVRVGLDDFVCYLLGRPDGLILRQPGTQVRQGDPLLTLMRGGRQFVLRSPLSGVIAQCNEVLAAHPERLEQTTGSSHWAYALKPSQLGEEIGGLQVAEKAQTWFRAELERLANWFAMLSRPQFGGVAMQDGGMPVARVLDQVDDQAWDEFQTLFLRMKNEN